MQTEWNIRNLPGVFTVGRPFVSGGVATVPVSGPRGLSFDTAAARDWLHHVRQQARRGVRRVMPCSDGFKLEVACDDIDTAVSSFMRTLNASAARRDYPQCFDMTHEDERFTARAVPGEVHRISWDR